MSVSISGSFLVIDLEVLVLLVFVDGEEEVGLGDYFLVYVALKSDSLLFGESLLELKEVQLLLHQLRDLILDVLDVVVIIILNGSDRAENLLLLVRISQAVQPLGLSSLLSLLLSQHNLRLSLHGLESMSVEIEVSGFLASPLVL